MATPDRKRRTQLCHANLLKPYFDRDGVEKVELPTVKTDSSSALRPVMAAPGEDGSECFRTCLATCVSSMPAVEALEEVDVCEPDDAVLLEKLNNTESLANLQLLTELGALINEFLCLFSDTPTQTNLISHDIDVREASPIRQRFYRVSGERKKILEGEVQYLLYNDLAEKLFSSWTSPCILVKKANGTYRFCTDYRKLNSVTKSDSFPLPRTEDCVDKFGSAKYVTKLDLLKDWQIPLTERACEVSAFITPSGLYAYKVMAFGLRNAAATFQRLMNHHMGLTQYVHTVCYSNVIKLI